MYAALLSLSLSRRGVMCAFHLCHFGTFSFVLIVLLSLHIPFHSHLFPHNFDAHVRLRPNEKHFIFPHQLGVNDFFQISKCVRISNICVCCFDLKLLFVELASLSLSRYARRLFGIAINRHPKQIEKRSSNCSIIDSFHSLPCFILTHES